MPNFIPHYGPFCKCSTHPSLLIFKSEIALCDSVRIIENENSRFKANIVLVKVLPILVLIPLKSNGWRDRARLDSTGCAYVYEKHEEEVIRIISARAAESHERRAYEEAHKRAEERHPRHRRKKRRGHWFFRRARGSGSR